MPIPCRSIATCASSLRGRRRRRRRGCRIGFTATSMRRRTFPSAAGAPRPPQCSRLTQREARAAIVVGGTGLYFSALTHGLAAVPPIPAQIRNEVRARLASDGVEALHAELTRRDPAAAARLMPGDRARVTRALEVILATGRSISQWHESNMPAVRRCGARRKSLPHARPRRAVAPHRRPLRRHDGGGRPGRGARARRRAISIPICRR